MTATDAPPREFDVIIYGASGYTGRLVAEHLAERYRDGEVRWAMAGRNLDKLAGVRDAIGAPSGLPLIEADADTPATLSQMAARARCVATTVGPYQLYGEPLVKACVGGGTHYVDLCGEPLWMRRMIDEYDASARESGARIVLSCGFDSIPFDLGVLFLQEEARRRFGAPLPQVRGRVRAMNGKFSGGTAASLGATMTLLQSQPELFELLRSDFALTPGFTGPAQPPMNKPREDDVLGVWLAPFVMAPINTKNVHRTNALLNHAYGEDFIYDEMWITGPGEDGRAAAEYLAKTDLIGGPDAPKPGEGPTKEERESGFYDLLFFGHAPDGALLKASVKGDKDPGYGSTSKMIAQTALCLLEAQDIPGGVWTPGAALGARLIERLSAEAGLTFAMES